LLLGDPALALKIPIPYKPTEVEIQSTEAGIKLSWQAANDSEGNPVAGYNVYRSSTPGGNYIKINTELITETEFLDTDPGGVMASGSGGSGGGIFYYGVTSVDDSGDESAQTLGASPAILGASSGGGGGGGGCFISTVSKSASYRITWVLVTLTITSVIASGVRRRALGAPVKFAALVFCEEFNGASQALGVRRSVKEFNELLKILIV
jgi:hypothetical protein